MSYVYVKEPEDTLDVKLPKLIYLYCGIRMARPTFINHNDAILGLLIKVDLGLDYRACMTMWIIFNYQKNAIRSALEYEIFA